MHKKLNYDIIIDGGALVSTRSEKSSWHAEDTGWPLKKSGKNILVITRKEDLFEGSEGNDQQAWFEAGVSTEDLAVA